LSTSVNWKTSQLAILLNWYQARIADAKKKSSLKISSVQMKSRAGKALEMLETVNCFDFLKCKLTVVIMKLTANLKCINKKSFCFFAMFYIKNSISNESYSRSKYLKAPFAENKHVQLLPI
jgi:hypothetical protein